MAGELHKHPSLAPHTLPPRLIIGSLDHKDLTDAAQPSVFKGTSPLKNKSAYEVEEIKNKMLNFEQTSKKILKERKTEGKNTLSNQRFCFKIFADFILIFENSFRWRRITRLPA